MASLSNITTPNPCGQPMQSLMSKEVIYGSDVYIDVTFNGTLKPPVRLYPVINNRATYGTQGKQESSPGLICPNPLEFYAEREYRWRVGEAKNGTNQLAGFQSWGVSVGDFIWFTAEELRNDTTAHVYQTTSNFTVIANATAQASGAGRETASKSAALLLAGLAVSALMTLTI